MMGTAFASRGDEIHGTDALEPSAQDFRRAPRLGGALLTAGVLGLAAIYAVPRATEAISSLDDPVRIADRALDGTFSDAVARREIESALAVQDSDLAQSFVDLAVDRQVKLDPALIEKVSAAQAEAATARHKVASFARGFVTGEPDDMAALAGTALGDLTLFGDIRDALREATRLAKGQAADELMLGLAGAGIAITAATYATFGAGAPARVGLTLAKAARKSGTLSAELAGSVGRMVRQARLSAAGPATRGARDAVKAERAGGLFNLASDIGRIERASGARAALDGLKIAKDPRDITRLARLSEKEGSRTRAILKVAGRGAIMVAALAVDATSWLLGAFIAVFGFVSGLKGLVERTTLRILRRRREKRMRNAIPPFAAASARS
jgi:hypothetical protein